MKNTEATVEDIRAAILKLEEAKEILSALAKSATASKNYCSAGDFVHYAARIAQILESDGGECGLRTMVD